MKLNALQGGRAIAALMVVVFHANVVILPERIFKDGTQAWSGFNMGYAGVEFFFVLSGFIMVYIHQRDFDKPDRAWRFMRKRVTRIYPVYWVILAALVMLYNLVPSRGPETAREASAVLAAFALVPEGRAPILEVAWTLQFEMFFYLIFAGMILAFRPGVWLFVIWMAMCFAGLFIDFENMPWRFLFSPYNIVFLTGILAALGYHRLPEHAAVPLILIGLLVFFATGLSEAVGTMIWHTGLRTVIYGLSAGAVVAGLARTAEQTNRKTPKSFVFLGDASYSIYLVHVPAMSLASLIFVEMGITSLPPLPVLIGAVVFGTIAGIAVHLTIERPFMLYFQRNNRAPKHSNIPHSKKP
ncbi:MAG: acyltransferase [Sulfitobacter sp.]